MPNKKDYTNGLPDPAEFKAEILKKYPRKVAKKRDKGMVINNPGESQEILANVRTVPGIITQRGCTYAGCKGVVSRANTRHYKPGSRTNWLQGFYAWLTRRNQNTRRRR